MNLSINFKSIKFTNIVVVSSRASYTWYMDNFFAYYSNVWIYCVESDSVTPTPNTDCDPLEFVPV